MNNIIIHNEEEFRNAKLLCNENLRLVLYKGRFDQGKLMSCTPNYFYLAEKIDSKFKMLTRNKYDKLSDEYVYINVDYRFEIFLVIGYYFDEGKIYPITKKIEDDYMYVDLESGIQKRLSKYSLKQSQILYFSDYHEYDLEPIVNEFLVKNECLPMNHTRKGEVGKQSDEVKKIYIDLETTYPFDDFRPKTVALDLIDNSHLTLLPRPMKLNAFSFFETYFGSSHIVSYTELEENFLNHKCKIPEKSKLTNHLDEQFLLLL